MPQATKEEKMDLISEMLMRGHLEYSRKRGMVISQNEWCKVLGVPTTSYSQWINKLRLPVGNNIHKLAEVIGPEIYDALEVPRHMPDDPDLAWIASVWHHLTEEQQKDIVAMARNLARESEGKEKNKN